MTRLCAPLTADSVDAMIEQIGAAHAARAEMIELRVDFLRQPNAQGLATLAEAAASFDGDVIVTCRISEEGGRFSGDEADRLQILRALAGAADYIDLEYAAWRRSSDLREGFDRLKSASPQHAPKLILSRHDFERTPADLDAMVDEIAAEPCDVIKIACQAEAITDALRMLDILHDWAPKRPTIALSMGETGVLPRVLARKFGGLLTFASLEAGAESAPGQITIEEMTKLYRWYSLSPETDVYGVIGCPVAHSMSPAIHNAAFDETGHDGIYLPLRIEPDYEAFQAFVQGCVDRPWLSLRGCSVTIPHKENLLRYVEQVGGDIEPLARHIGVANTLSIDPAGGPQGVWISAHNTDYRGALEALCDGMGIQADDLATKHVAVLGAGGVSRAIVAGLKDIGCKVTIYNRTLAKAEALAREFKAAARPLDDRTDHNADVVINCTSIGMWPEIDGTPLPAEGLAHKPAVFDTVYNPVETRLLREARERGCRTVDGVAMFVNQAVAQFERWTDRAAPIDRMREVVLARLKN